MKTRLSERKPSSRSHFAKSGRVNIGVTPHTVRGRVFERRHQPADRVSQPNSPLQQRRARGAAERLRPSAAWPGNVAAKAKAPLAARLKYRETQGRNRRTPVITYRRGAVTRQECDR